MIRIFPVGLDFLVCMHVVSFSNLLFFVYGLFSKLFSLIKIEYVPDAYKRREFLTEFRGSAGTAVVTQDVAYVWTDSRYWNEANLQLDPSIWMMQKVGLPDTPTIPKWLAETAMEFWKKDKNNSMKIAMDPYVHPASFVKEVQEEMQKMMREEAMLIDVHDAEDTSSNMMQMPGLLIPEYTNLIDEIWGTDRPAIPTSPFRIHPIEYAGTSVETKVTQIRNEMQTKKSTIAVFSTLDDVAYLCNLRAQGDIDTCPVGIGYAIVTLDNIYLYCDPAKIVNIGEHLQASNISHRPYDQIVSDLQTWTENDPRAKVWMDKSRTNYAIVNVIPEKQLIDAQNAITPMKAVKNSAELAGMREAHIVDGVAMAHFMAWLEEQIVAVGRSVSEVEIDLVLTQYRAQQRGFVECSFPTIAGVGSNGAIIHYRASEDNPALLKHFDRQTSLLLDSGGQYLYGTTDVTRTWSFQNPPDPAFCDYYTRVLKGNIGLDRMIFPENTPGFVLDTYAVRCSKECTHSFKWTSVRMGMRSCPFHSNVSFADFVVVFVYNCSDGGCGIFKPIMDTVPAME
jgi:Xaa-Pro aminopeptidase